MALSDQNKTDTKKSHPFQSLGILSILTFLSRIAGLIREMVKTYFFGISFLSDAFNLAFSIPNLFRRLTAEGAMQNAFVPTLAKVDKELGEDGRVLFVNSFFWWLSLSLSVFVFFFIFFAPELIEHVFARGFAGSTLDETIYLTRMMFVYIFFISLAAILQAILNFHTIFWISALSPVLLNISMITSVFLLQSYFDNAARAMAVGVLVGGFLQLIIQVPFARKLNYYFFRFRFLFNQYSKKTFQYFLPGIFGAGVYQLNIIVSNLIATTLVTGSITALTISNRLIEFVLGIFIVSISTIILPNLSKLLANDEIEQAKTILIQGLKLSTFVIIPVIAGLFVIGYDVIRMLFAYGEFTDKDALFTYHALQFHVFGLLFISWNRILTAGFYAKKWYKRNVTIAFWVFLLNTILSLSFVGVFSYSGIALANTLSQAFQSLLMIIVCYRFLKVRLFDRSMILLFLKTLLATSIMVLILYFLISLLDQTTLAENLVTFCIIIVGVISFVISSLLLKIKELETIKNIFFSRGRHV